MLHSRSFTMSEYDWSSECVPLAYRGTPSPTTLSYKESVDAVTKECPECGDSFTGGDIVSRPGCSGGCWCWYHLSCCETMACSKQPCRCSNCGGQLFLNSRTVLERFEILPPSPPSSTTSTTPSSPDSYAAETHQRPLLHLKHSLRFTASRLLLSRRRASTTTTDGFN